MSWKNHRYEHSLASKGVKSKPVKIHKMKGSLLFHATPKRNVNRILKEGITPQEKSTYTGLFGQELKDKNKIYAFDTFDDAVRWGGKMEYDLDEPVVVFVYNDRKSDYEQDTHIQIMGGKGTGLKRSGKIKPAKILDVIDITLEMKKTVIKNLGKKEILKYPMVLT